MTLALHLGKGAVASVKEGKGARKRLLPEREETWELGNGKGQGSPLRTHGFLSPPPPSANTWHGHKQGLCSLSLGQDWIQEAKSRQQGVGWGRADWAAPLNQGKRALPSGVGSSPHPACHRHRPLTRQRCHRIRGSWHFSRGVGGRRASAGGGELSVVFFLTPSCPASCPFFFVTPLLPFSKYCSHNFRKLKGKNKESHGASYIQYHLPHSPKPAQEKLTPFCPEPSVTL